VAAHIGGFRVHPGQLSERAEQYRSEIQSFSRAPSLIDRLQCLADRLCWAAPQRVRNRVSRPNLIFYDQTRKAWRRAREA
jgi:hypothetical protein